MEWQIFCVMERSTFFLAYFCSRSTQFECMSLDHVNQIFLVVKCVYLFYLKIARILDRRFQLMSFPGIMWNFDRKFWYKRRPRPGWFVHKSGRRNIKKRKFHAIHLAMQLQIWDFKTFSHILSIKMLLGVSQSVSLRPEHLQHFLQIVCSCLLKLVPHFLLDNLIYWYGEWSGRTCTKSSIQLFILMVIFFGRKTKWTPHFAEMFHSLTSKFRDIPIGQNVPWIWLLFIYFFFLDFIAALWLGRANCFCIL